MRWKTFTQADNVDYIVLLRFRGWSVRLHRFRGPDGPWFHSHPAEWSFRLILRGAYLEQRYPSFKHKAWTRGMFGVVRHTDTHRIVLVSSTCYTLWIRGPKEHEVKTIHIQD